MSVSMVVAKNVENDSHAWLNHNGPQALRLKPCSEELSTASCGFSGIRCDLTNGAAYWTELIELHAKRTSLSASPIHGL